MTEQAKKYLSDIFLAIDKIDQFMEGIDNYYDYEADLKTQSAIERQLSIIGEAINQLRKIGVRLEHDHQMVGFRNRLIHAYDSIDNTIVWAIINRHIPKLKDDLFKL
ncbi:DUF86 domain-containing protein [Echinicola marina]|uniref:HepT-like ribonuclease domain-containing protein n=1 Tax=Echinicola marina TaxID=2859768 RepID=UPI001CF6B3C8|nr:HepT-like ribonuclease domain-containing protein [Echinicola marina]UCS92197.1 DUF86 domain-containing protein [Echinicola marina]